MPVSDMDHLLGGVALSDASIAPKKKTASRAVNRKSNTQHNKEWIEYGSITPRCLAPTPLNHHKPRRATGLGRRQRGSASVDIDHLQRGVELVVQVA